jgi:hypothetical protein
MKAHAYLAGCCGKKKLPEETTAEKEHLEIKSHFNNWNRNWKLT